MATEADIAVFYSLELVNPFMQEIIKNPAWGTFIEPDHDLSHYTNPNEKYHLTSRERHHLNFNQFLNQDKFFDELIEKVKTEKSSITTSNQCTNKYYYELHQLIKFQQNSINTLVEVGPQLGDLSLFLASCIESSGINLDLVDTNLENLRYAYERIFRVFPHIISKVRLFFGDLPKYTQCVLMNSANKNFIHYKGSHSFNDIIRDIGSLSYVKDKIPHLVIHDTHLRSLDMHEFAFADAALFSLFGKEIQCLPLGEIMAEEIYLPQSSHYLAKNQVEGFYIPLMQNKFHSPHPIEVLDNFIYK